MSISSQPYGVLSDGRSVDQYTLVNGDLTCKIITFGGIVTELHVPDRDGVTRDVVLGLPSLAAYEAGHPYLGAIVGRVAGRINGGSFELDGVRHDLPLSQPPNHLHGGVTGLDKRVWQAKASENEEGEPVLRLSYRSPEGEENYPGNVDITVRYTLTHGGALEIDYEAATDKATPFSPTNHSYFHLAGEDANQTIADHELRVFADRMVQGDEEGTLDLAVSSVADTPHDFRDFRSLSDFIAPPHGFHGENYLFEGGKSDRLRPAAILRHPPSGRVMQVHTTESGVQLYTGKFLEDAELIGKSGHPYRAHGAVCLECQGFPNAVNSPGIDDIILRPGTPYRQTTLYRFSAE